MMQQTKQNLILIVLLLAISAIWFSSFESLDEHFWILATLTGLRVSDYCFFAYGAELERVHAPILNSDDS